MEKEQTQPEHRPVLLFAFANDDRPGRRLDGLRREIEAVRRTLTPAEREGLCEIIVRESTTPDELVEVLEDPRYRRRLALIHFAGHAGESRLLLEGNGEPVAARIQGLAPLLGELDNLAMLFLNGCATLEQGKRLIEEGIPAVIATEHSVEDTQTQRFAADFYRGLASGASVSECFEHALSQARCFTPMSGVARDLVPSPRVSDVPTPWRLLLAEPRGDAKDWSLPAAANDPLFGLPAPVGGMLPQEPFMGLRRFRAQDSTVFFGRGWAIRNLYQDVLDPKMPPVLVVYGASGVGKSSLLEAGLLPRVAATHETHELRLERKQDPEEMLRRALQSPDGQAHLAEAWRAREDGGGRPVVVCLDQLEALVLEGGKRALARFIRALKPLYDNDGRPRGKLVLGLRKEWYPELRNELRRHGMAWHEHFVEPLGREDLEEIVLGVTRTASMRARYGITCENGLAARIADDLSQDRESAIAPMLQILLTRMWAGTEPQVTSTDGRLSRYFSMEIYDELRRDGLALSDFVKRQLESLHETHSEELASGLVLDLLVRHTTSRGTAKVCTYKTLREIYAHQSKSMESLVERCIALYLLQPVAGDRGREDGVRLAHDTLAPIIRDRHTHSKAPGQAAARLLDARMGMAETSGRSRLLDEHDLEEVEAAQGGMRRWNEAEQQLVAASRRRRRRRAWFRRGQQVLVVGSVGVAIVVIATRRLVLESEPASDAMVIRSATSPSLPLGPPPSLVEPEIDTAPSGARSNGEKEGAPTTDGTSPNEGALDDTMLNDLAQVDDVRSTRTPAMQEKLATAKREDSEPRCILRRLPTGLTGSTARIEKISTDATGGRLAIGMGERNKAFVLEPLDAAPTLLEVTTLSAVNGFAWSPDGHLGIAQEGGKVQLMRWKDEPELLPECTGHAKSVRTLAFSRDGALFVTGDTDGRVILRDARSCAPLDEMKLGARIEVLAEGDGQAWMVAGSSGHWMSWTGGETRTSVSAQLEDGDVIRQVFARPRGQWVLVAGTHLYSWSASGASTQKSSGSSSYAIFWAFDAEDDGVLLTASRNAVELWSRDTSSWVVADTEPMASTITGVAASHDRRDLFVADSDGKVHWLHRGTKELTRLRSFEISSDRLSSIAVHPRMDYFAVGDHAGSVTLVTLPDPSAPGAAVMCALERVDENPPAE